MNQPNPARPSLLGTAGTLISGGGGLYAVAHADVPWWVIALLVVLVVLVGGTLGLAQILIPQESRDKGAWWSELWKHHRRHRRRHRQELDRGR